MGLVLDGFRCRLGALLLYPGCLNALHVLLLSLTTFVGIFRVIDIRSTETTLRLNLEATTIQLLVTFEELPLQMAELLFNVATK